MLYLTESEVRSLLPMRTAIELMRAAFVRLASGEAINQPRRRLALSTGSVLHYMAGGDGKYFGAKIYSTNAAHGAHFVFLLYRAEDGAPLALLEANHLGQIRTGAASGFATDLMARRDAKTVAIIGSGFQAATQLEAIRAVRDVTVRVWSRNPAKRERFAAEHGVQGVATAEEAIRGADIVVTATNAREPVFDAAWLGAGVHINAMGSNQARRRELPAEAVRRADVIAIDSKEQGRMESGDLLLAGVDWDRVVELQEIASGRTEGRPRPDSLTIFKSNGLAVEDVISAGYVYERALEMGVGRPLHS